MVVPGEQPDNTRRVNPQRTVEVDTGPEGTLSALEPGLQSGYVPALNDRAEIMSAERFTQLREAMGLEDFSFTSGGFAPGHPGHFELVKDSQLLFGKPVVVCVNGDDFLIRKHGTNFMDLDTRSEIMSYMTGGDYIVPFELENDRTMIVPLKTIQPKRFTKGGDRHSGEIPEGDTCKEFDIEVVNGVGGTLKMASSSDFLRDFAAAARADFGKFNSPETHWLDGEVHAPQYDFFSSGLPTWMTAVTTDSLLSRSAERESHLRQIREAEQPLSLGSHAEIAPVVSPAHFNRLAASMDLGRVIAVAGEFGPVVPSELEELQQLKQSGDTLVAIVADDDYLMRRHEGIAFQDLPMRSQCMSYVRGVDFVIPAAGFSGAQPNDRDFSQMKSVLTAHSFHIIDNSSADVTARSLMIRFADFVRRNPETFIPDV